MRWMVNITLILNINDKMSFTLNAWNDLLWKSLVSIKWLLNTTFSQSLVLLDIILKAVNLLYGILSRAGIIHSECVVSLQWIDPIP